MNDAVIKSATPRVHGDVDIKKDDIVEVWTGAATGSPFPPKPGDRWDEARVVEVKDGSAQITWTSSRPGMPWVPLAAVRPRAS